MIRVLALDDEPEALRLLTNALSPDHQVTTFIDGTAALEAIERGAWDLVLVDLNMPFPDGFEVLRRVQQFDRPVPVIVVSAMDRARAVVEALKIGARDFIVKPATFDEIRASVTSVMATTHGASGASVNKYGLAGPSEAITRVRQVIPLLARIREMVLVVGETGSGKELLARAVHKISPRSHGPFIAHNMAATPTELTESIFFGHARGAFSGATAEHVGLFEQAHQGTLFLDEVDSFPLALQAKLLRVLESGCVSRVGSVTERTLDVRVIAASSVDLRDRAAQNLFRADLYYRLCQFEVHLPPLRERVEDIPELVGQFLDELTVEMGARPRLTDGAMNALLPHNWPGNVRELRHAIRRAALLAGTGPIVPGHLPAHVRRPPCASSAIHSDMDLVTVEHSHILSVLDRVLGNRSLAARVLGIDRGTLARKLKAAQSLRPVKRG